MPDFQKFLTKATTTHEKTTFFHEIATSIYLRNINAKIENGSSILKFYKSKLFALENNIDFSTVYAKFLIDETPPEAILTDARNIAKFLIDKAGKPDTNKPIIWTGPSNASGDYGAADLVYFVKGEAILVSIKKDVGQFKNLTLGTVGRVLFQESNIIKTLYKDTKSQWDSLTREWIQMLIKQFPKVREVLEVYKDTTWDKYQKQQISKEDLLKLDIKKHNSYLLSYFCKKLFVNMDKVGKEEWGKIRGYYFQEIFGSYFEKRKETVNKNLELMFKILIGVTEKHEMWYVANGGLDYFVIPNKTHFYNSVKDLEFTQKSFPNMGGYVFSLIVKKDNKILIEIDTTIRWKAGQMIGLPESSSTLKFIDKELWAKIFT